MEASTSKRKTVELNAKESRVKRHRREESTVNKHDDDSLQQQRQQQQRRQDPFQLSESSESSFLSTSTTTSPTTSNTMTSYSSYSKADPETLTNRRVLTASSSLPQKGKASPGRRAGSNIRKHKRLKLYYTAMAHLNSSFASFCQQAESELTINPKTPQFYRAAEQYLHYASQIEHAYNPPAGNVYTFGSGDCGQLALSESVLGAGRPRPVVNLFNLSISSVACGGLHNAALTDSGAVYSWGCNDEGSVGIASVETSFAAMLVYGFTPSAFELATGLEGVPTWKQVLADTANGATDTTTSTKIADNSAENSHLEESMIMAAAGDCQTLTLSTTGRVYFFGCYKDVEGKAWRDLTPPDDVRVHPRPEKRNGDAAPCGKQLWPIHVWNMPGKVLHIDCGCSFNAAIVEMPFRETTNRVCVTWGLGETGELARPVRKGLKNSDYTFKDGDGPYAPYHVDWVREDYVVPQPVVWEEEPKEGYKRVVEFVACGGYHLLVIARDVRVQDDENDAFANSEPVVYGSGLNQYGQLGLGMTKNVEKLTRIKALDGLKIAKIAAGIHHTLCLDESGRNLYAFGRGDSGQLGTTTTRPAVGHFSSTPLTISIPSSSSSSKIGTIQPTIADIGCGGNHNFLLTESGQVYSWGYGDMGALGHGRDEDEYQPRLLDVLAHENSKRKKEGEKKGVLKGKVHQVAGGGQHSVLIMTTQG